jgi:hypothetical protein
MPVRPSEQPVMNREDRDFGELVANAMLHRREFFEKYFDRRRNIDDECGYPETGELTAERYWAIYERFGIARRVVEVLAKSSWQSPPSVYEDPDQEEMTPFEESLSDLCSNMGGEQSFHNNDENVKNVRLWNLLKEADVLSGIGHYGIIVLGIDDGLELHMPVANYNPRTNKFATSPTKKRNLINAIAFSEANAKVVTWNESRMHPRYGLPEMYSVTFNNLEDSSVDGRQPGTYTKEIHWTRVVHISRGRVFHTPIMKPVFNTLLDMQKLYGGSAEMYWCGAFPGLSFETHPQLGGDVVVPTDMRDQVEKYYTGLQRYLSLMGMSAKSLAPQVSDPTSQIRVQLENLCISLSIPLRVFLGSERGELASGQDKQEWDEELDANRCFHITPNVLLAFVDRCINLTLLPEPPEGPPAPARESPDRCGPCRGDGQVRQWGCREFHGPPGLHDPRAGLRHRRGPGNDQERRQADCRSPGHRPRASPRS